MDDGTTEDDETIDYGPYEADIFNVWVELGAADPDDQRVLHLSPMRRYIKNVKSSSPEANKLIHQPLRALLDEGIPGVTESSRITSTILHHERGLNKRIIRIAISVEEESGDVAMEFDKQTW
jgi:hypothetical protein